ncbi:type II secretion system protein [Photobacterium indicum]|uniref:type II secretion system protein n=1 Tax=Photobacterium indicum TaxID=81447 RepID=UPI003D0CCD15
MSHKQQASSSRKANAQRGFGLVETLLTLVILSIFTIGLTNALLSYYNKRNALTYKVHIEHVIEQLQQYQYHKVTVDHVSPYSTDVWPDTLDKLMTDYDSQFWPMCSMDEQKLGKCDRPDRVPWTKNTDVLGYEVTPAVGETVAKAILTFPLSSTVIDPDDRAVWAAELSRLPFVRVLPNDDITVLIGDPLMAQVYREFLRIDGTTELTDEWDTGNQPILNAKSVSVKTQANTQQRLGLGTVKEYLAQNGDKVYKNAWSCATGLRPTLHVSVNAIFSENKDEYIGTASFKPFVIDKGTYWELGLNYNAKIKSTGQWKERHDGYLTVSEKCSS